MCLPGTSISVCVFKHRFGPVLNDNSHIFVYSTSEKGQSFFCLLTETIFNKAGDPESSAFFMAAEI